MNPQIEFREFPKIARLNRDVIFTEKIDGTNACVVIAPAATSNVAQARLVLGPDNIQYAVAAQSRTRIITPEDDNFGFAKWTYDHAEELLVLGPGHHFGEWWGRGIQRGYGLSEKRFSLFNVERWTTQTTPTCCRVVPLLYVGNAFDMVSEVIDTLRRNGSAAAPGFMKPEGIVAYHKQGNLSFKVTLEKDSEWKGKSA